MGMPFNSGTGGQPQGPQMGFGMPAGGYGQDPQQGFGLDPMTGLPFGSQPQTMDIQGNQSAANLLPPGGMSGGMGGGKTANMIPGQAQMDPGQFNTNAIFGGGQQQPITQGNGVLPPGFGELSPIDRSQIGGAQIGMTGRPQPMPYTGTPQPMSPPAPTNRYAPQPFNAQSFRTAGAAGMPVNPATQMGSVNARPGTQMSANNVQRQQNNAFGNVRGQTAYSSPGTPRPITRPRIR